MNDKLLQVIVFIALITMPLWAGAVLGIDRNGPYLHSVDQDR